MREQLLGYLLGALEPAEHASVEAELALDPELRRELEKLRASLFPLDESADEEEHELAPPPGLATRTFQFVKAHASWNTSGSCAAGAGSWRAPDYAVAAGIFFVASMLVFPAVQQSRAGARVTSCQNKLQQIGMAMAQYAQLHGCLPFVPASGNRAAAGIYAPWLMQAGLISSPSTFLCPESPQARQKNFQVPTFKQLDSANPKTLRILHRSMGGSFGYHPGHIENGRYVPTPHQPREYFAIMADAADEVTGDRSSNHGRRGQNVLLQSGRVVFIVIPRMVDSGDHIYVNDLGGKGAGRGANDSSICNSATPPLAQSVLADQ